MCVEYGFESRYVWNMANDLCAPILHYIYHSGRDRFIALLIFGICITLFTSSGDIGIGPFQCMHLVSFFYPSVQAFTCHHEFASPLFQAEEIEEWDVCFSPDHCLIVSSHFGI